MRESTHTFDKDDEYSAACVVKQLQTENMSSCLFMSLHDFTIFDGYIRYIYIYQMYPNIFSDVGVPR